MALLPGIVEALVHIVGPRHVRFANGAGRSLRSRESHSPDATVYPGSTCELAQLMRGATACGIAVHTTDGSTLLDGDSGHIVLSQKRLNRILEINPNQLTCRLQPEVPLDHLNRTLAAAGLAIAPVPSASDGLSSVANAVAALKAVTSSGAVVEANRVVHDDHANIVDLLMRAAGTFCLLAELTVELAPTSLCGNQPGRKEPL